MTAGRVRRPRLLVTGASGMLGANLVLIALGRCRVTAHAYPPALRPMGFESLASDLTQAGEVNKLLHELRPDWVIHCAAQADVDACERDPGMALRLNRDMAMSVARAAAALGARLIHISTDAVFDGQAGAYDEADAPAPINVYGRSKLEAERAVLEAHPRALVVRTNFFTWPAPRKTGLAGWFLSRLERGQECPGFSDSWFNPMLASILAGILLDLAVGATSGVLHVAGRSCVSKHEFGIRLAQAFGLDSTLVRSAPSDSAGLTAERGKNLCLNTAKVEQLLGKRMPTLDESLHRFRLEKENGFSDGLKAIRDEMPAGT